MAIVESTLTGNPYVGPRSITYGEPIHGRDRQIDELRNIVIAERVVLMYSPSGAGKSSLLEAGLRPELEAREFLVLPTIRVGLDAPSGNRYAVSAMLSLEEGRPESERLPVAELAEMSLADYLDRLAGTEELDADPCLFIDQFEEVFTLDPTDQDAKSAFFRDLGTALKDRGRWAVLAMREDFIAQLDPYLDQLPGRLRSRYRLDLLAPLAAHDAIKTPAARAGRRIPDEVVDQLVDDLRTVQVQRGVAVERELGPVVEPVQLQVVCRRLWDSLDDGVVDVTGADVGALGTVDESLAAYVDEAVASAAAASGLNESTIRQWMDDELLTESGFRTQVERGPEGGAAGATVLRHLEDAHLIRSERRRGTSWWELAHDRLVGPLQSSNAAWAAAHDTALTREARDWDAQGRPEALLVRGRRLDLLQREAEARADGLPPLERAFVDASRAAERRRRRKLQLGAVGALVVTSVLLGAVVISARKAADARRARVVALAAAARADAEEQRAVAEARAADRERAAADAERRTAEEQKRAAQVGEAKYLLLEAQRIAPEAPEVAARLALTARRFVDADQTVTPLAAVLAELERHAADALPRPRNIGVSGRPTSVWPRPDGSIVFTDTVSTWLVGTDGRAESLKYGDPLSNEVTATVSPDGRWLVAQGALTQATSVFDLTAPDGVPVTTIGTTADRPRLVAWSLDSTVLVTASDVADSPGTNRVAVYDASAWTRAPATFDVTTVSRTAGAAATVLDEQGNVFVSGSPDVGSVTALAVSRDGSLIMADSNGDVVYRARTGEERTRRVTGLGAVRLLSERLTGELIAATDFAVAQLDPNIDVFPVPTRRIGGSRTVALSDRYVAWIESGSATLWDPDTDVVHTLAGATSGVTALRFSADGSHLVAAGDMLYRWDTGDVLDDVAESQPNVSVGFGDRSTATVTADRRFAVLPYSVSFPDGTFRVRYHDLTGKTSDEDVDLPRPDRPPAADGGCATDDTGARNLLRVAAGGRAVVAASRYGTLVWDVDTRTTLGSFPTLPCRSTVYDSPASPSGAVSRTATGEGAAVIADAFGGPTVTAPVPAALLYVDASGDGRLWALTPGKLLSWRPGDAAWHGVEVAADAPSWLAVTEDGSKAATESAGRVRVFSTADGTMLSDVRSNLRPESQVYFSQDGSALVLVQRSASLLDSAVSILDPVTGIVTDVAPGAGSSGLDLHRGHVSLASNDGRTVHVRCDGCQGVDAMATAIASRLERTTLDEDERRRFHVTLTDP